MFRDAEGFLEEWLQAPNRKPLLIRGARQVGKTFLVRAFAGKHSKKIIEINFERNPAHASLFNSNDPHQILKWLEASFNGAIDVSASVLFLDEIQVAPELLAKLRWFAEELPELPVLAAGSLLEFALAEHRFSMPVGRVQYLYLEPLSFSEFLQVRNPQLKEWLETLQVPFQAGSPEALLHAMPEPMHQMLSQFIKEYVIVGGMPAAVSAWVKSARMESVHQVHQDLLATYREDFSKYQGRLNVQYLDQVLQSIPRQLGRKFVLGHVDRDVSNAPLKTALERLIMARLAFPATASHANGVPIGAEVQVQFRKIFFLDVGLCNALLGLRVSALQSIEDLNLIHQGAVSEQLAAQLLRRLFPFFQPPAVYYWIRNEGSSAAEVDFVIEQAMQVIPIEVKSGSTGSLKSLHQFMRLKASPLAIRLYSGGLQLTRVKVLVPPDQTVVDYWLLSVPFYGAHRLETWITQVLEFINEQGETKYLQKD